jgi:VWFA-related protein
MSRCLSKTLGAARILGTAGTFGAAGFVLSTLLLSAQQTSPPSPGYTLQANTRVVLVDVTVTDEKGQTIHGLRASDFQVLDNKKPQQIASFEEHFAEQTTPVAQPARAAGVYSNDYLAHPPATVNVIFLDMINISIEDQAYLQYQLDKLFDQLRRQDQVAIYARTGGASFLLQGFTSDRTLLRKAVRSVIPRFPQPGRTYLTDGQLLEQMAFHLGDIPGRKNVLWFSGGSTLYLHPPQGFVRGFQSGALQSVSFQSLQPIYDLLEADRIAIYPIDVRGLTTAEPLAMFEQHSVMSQTAEATGGRAVVNNNGLALNAAAILQEDGDYYTLTYTPEHLVYNNKWHNIRVTSPGRYLTLRYRRGYFADALQPNPSMKSQRTRTRLLAAGNTVQEPPSAHQPIIFEASVTSSAPAGKGKSLPLTVHYSLPLDAFAMKTANGKATVFCGAAVFVLNANGTQIGQRAEQVTFTLKESVASNPAGRSLPIDLTLAPQKGDVYLLVAAWDLGGGQRMGTLEIPYRVPKPVAAKAAR